MFFSVIPPYPAYRNNKLVVLACNQMHPVLPACTALGTLTRTMVQLAAVVVWSHERFGLCIGMGYPALPQSHHHRLHSLVSP